MNKDNTRNKTQKVLAFFESDIKEKDPNYLQRAFDEGYTLLALDTAAVGLAVAAQVPYTLIDDWIDDGVRLEIRRKAIECDYKWFEAARDEFTIDGVCWPEFDRHAMHWFWDEVSFADALAESFRSSNISDLKFFRHSPPRPSMFYNSSDIYSAYWEAVLGYKAELLEEREISLKKRPFWHRMVNYGRSNVRSIARSIKGTLNEFLAATTPDVLSGKVVLAFNPDEFYRFTPIIQELSKSFPGKVAAVICSPDRTIADEIAAKWSIPVVCGPTPTPLDSDLQNKFWNAYSRALDHAVGQLWHKPLKHLGFHFKQYCQQRWPALVNDFRFWCQLWSEVHPEAVLTSALYDSESRLPAEAARRSGIQTLSIPHGAVQMADNLLSSDYILYSCLTQKIAWEQAGVALDCLKPCCKAIAENEYPFSARSDHHSSPRWRLLALTSSINWVDHRLLLGVSIRSQLMAIQTLDNPPGDISEKLELRIKTHPDCPELEVFDLVSHEIVEKVLLPNTGLRAELERTDLVIAVNYTGSALIHALRLGKPVILFWTDLVIGKSEIFSQMKLFIPGGELARTPEEFWGLVRDFFTNPEFAEEMRMKAQNFSQNNLDDSNYPSLGEVVRQALIMQKH